MKQRPSFDDDEFIRGYRAACARRGIDPVCGASGYQVVHVIAEQRRAAWRRKGKMRHWWQQHELWLNCPPYRSETEQAAIWGVFVQAYAITAIRMAGAVRRRRAAMPLRELHHCQTRGK